MTETTTPTTASEWADALDAASKDYDGGAADLVSWTYANGSVCGISIDEEADDDSGRRLTSANGLMVVRYSQQDGYWTAVDTDTQED